MEATFPKALTLAEIADRCVEKGQQEKAAEPLSQALEVANSIGNAHAKGKVLAAIGFLYAKTGQDVDDSAKKILHEMVAKLGEKGRREQPVVVKKRMAVPETTPESMRPLNEVPRRDDGQR
jgi:hypothetical protein